MNMSLPPPGWSFEALQASQPIESTDSGEPQEVAPHVIQEDEESPEFPEHPVDASTSSDEDSEDELRCMEEAEGKDTTGILTRFTRKLEVVEANTEKMAEYSRGLGENVAQIDRNSRTLNEKLNAVKASMTEMQNLMTSLVERNRLHEIGTHNIRFHTQNMAQEAMKMGKDMDLHQIALMKQHSTIFLMLRQINKRLDHFKIGHPVAEGASAPGASEKSSGNLSLNTLSILTFFMSLLVLAAFKYFEILHGS